MFKKYFSLSFAVLILFVVDRVLKFYFLKNPSLSFGGDFIFGLLNFQLEKNSGVAFGILINQSLLLVLVAVIILILFWILSKAYRVQDLFTVFSLTLIITGAFSNLFDRLRYDFVVDYINIPFFTVFNLADIMITAGVCLLLLKIIKKRPAEARKA